MMMIEITSFQFLIFVLSIFGLFQDIEASFGLRGACKTGNYSLVPVDPLLYSGTWYEQAHSKSFLFGSDCVCTTAEYTFLEDKNRFRVLNSCRRREPTAPLYQREGNARQVEPGRLSVNFFYGLPIADADYRIVYVDDEYDHAIIVSCSWIGGSLTWIVSRTAMISDEKYDELYGKVREMGFDTSDLVRTQQNDCWSFRTKSQSVMKRPVREFAAGGGVPPKCALPSQVSSFPVEKLGTRWHIMYTQPDFVEDIFSKNCYCNTVTLEKSTLLPDPKTGEKYPGTFRSTVTCRNGAVNGKRSDFVRPVYEISNITSNMGHYVQQLWGGLAQEHWQILAYGHDDLIESTDPTDPVKSDRIEHMLLYTCLDTKLFGQTYCIHIVSRNNIIDPSVVRKYQSFAEKLGVYKPEVMRPVVHGDHCIYDPDPVHDVLVVQ